MGDVTDLGGDEAGEDQPYGMVSGIERDERSGGAENGRAGEMDDVRNVLTRRLGCAVFVAQERIEVAGVGFREYARPRVEVKLLPLFDMEGRWCLPGRVAQIAAHQQPLDTR